MCKTALLAFFVINIIAAFSSCKKDGGSITSDGELFRAGKNGYKFYRIPSLITTHNGTLLAFCEGRKRYVSDAGDIDIVFKRSTDNGVSWSSLSIVFDDGGNTCSNPCAVEDKETNTIWLFMCKSLGQDKQAEIIDRTSVDTRRVYVSKSTDDGVSWSTPKEVTKSTKNKNWDWYATGPGNGIQIQYGSNKGRLIIPSNHSFYPNDAFVENGFKIGSHVIYSDDHGDTWQYGATSGNNTTESQVVEIADSAGGLLLNSRSYSFRMQRAQSYSHDGGLTWTNPSNIESLQDPNCQGSIFRYSWRADTVKSILMFSNPASSTARVNLTLKASYDEGKTWVPVKTIYSGPSAYSSLTVLKNKDVGILYERGDDFANESIVYEKFTPSFDVNNQ